MARGKQAALSASRRLEAAHEHIDRLTSELATAKIRARDAEQRAARLEGVEALLQQRNNDELLADALEGLTRWRRVAREDHDRRRAALTEFKERVVRDLAVLGIVNTAVDFNELMWKRYPAVFTALCAGAEPPKVSRYNDLPPSARRLSDEEVKRLQRVLGLRATPVWDTTKDLADELNDVLDAKQIGFSREELRELFDLDSQTEVAS